MKYNEWLAALHADAEHNGFADNFDHTSDTVLLYFWSNGYDPSVHSVLYGTPADQAA